MIESKWAGSVEHEKGVATFTVDNLKASIDLNNFTDYDIITKLIDVAYALGKADAIRNLQSDFDYLINRNLNA